MDRVVNSQVLSSLAHLLLLSVTKLIGMSDVVVRL